MERRYRRSELTMRTKISREKQHFKIVDLTRVPNGLRRRVSGSHDHPSLIANVGHNESIIFPIAVVRSATQIH